MLKRCFASCALVLLLSSVFLVPCSASPYGSSYAMEVTAGFAFGDLSASGYYYAGIPSAGRWTLYSNASVTHSGQPMRVKSGLYAPVDYDRTLILSVGFQTETASGDSWFSGVDYQAFPDLKYTDSRDSGNTVRTLTDAVRTANSIYGLTGEAGEIFNYQVTIPAYSNMWEFNTSGFVNFTVAATPWHCVTYGGYIIDTADDSVLGVIQQILANTENIDANITTLIGAINEILAELRALNVDTDTIITLLNGLTDLSDRQLTQLELIAGSVDAIYYFLTQELKDESEQLSGEAGAVADQIQNNDAAEEYYQTSMQGSYDSLNLDGFTFGGVTGALELVGQIFSDVWGALGNWSILYTYPLVLGISLLAIGRLDKTGGGNSSRNAEHKGGEGGA